MSFTATNGGGQEGGIFKLVRALGKCLALGASILGTPALFNATKVPLYNYLAKTWGEGLAFFLTWIMAAVEAYAIYATATLAFTALVIWAMAKAAASGFSGE